MPPRKTSFEPINPKTNPPTPSIPLQQLAPLVDFRLGEYYHALDFYDADRLIDRNFPTVASFLQEHPDYTDTPVRFIRTSANTFNIHIIF